MRSRIAQLDEGVRGGQSAFWCGGWGLPYRDIAMFVLDITVYFVAKGSHQAPQERQLCIFWCLGHLTCFFTGRPLCHHPVVPSKGPYLRSIHLSLLLVQYPAREGCLRYCRARCYSGFGTPHPDITDCDPGVFFRRLPSMKNQSVFHPLGDTIAQQLPDPLLHSAADASLSGRATLASVIRPGPCWLPS